MLFAFSCKAQQTLPLYPAGKIPNAKVHSVEEKITEFSTDQGPMRFIARTSVPELTIYLPDKQDHTGIGVIICPGGGYTGVAIDHEGHLMAKKFNEHGIAAFVLKYRMPLPATAVNKENVPLQDAQRALQIVRERAGAWKLDPDKIGILGSSAGGHLASTAGTHYGRALIPNPRGTDLRPDFMILNYPVISFADSITHHGSRFNLIGEQSIEALGERAARLASIPVPEALVRVFSNERQVTPDTPPTFITHAMDDAAVPVQNSLLFIAALQQHGVPVESFFYARGGHGYGMYNPTAEQDWIEPCLDWVLERFGG